MSKIDVKSRRDKQEIAVTGAVENEGIVQMIQQLIPIGLMAVNEYLQSEVEALAGKRYSRGSQYARWGSNPGSVFLGDSKVNIRVPRVVKKGTRRTVPLSGYAGLQNPGIIDEQSLKKLINGLSCRRYRDASLVVPQVFGISSGSVSKRFIRVSAKKLEEFHSRRFDDLDLVAVFIDGKSFSGTDMIIALGVDVEGNKTVLGFIESVTENEQVCKDFLNSLKDRGLKLTDEVLYVVDGAKGLTAGIRKVVGAGAVIQRCQWHKRENVLSYLSKEKQVEVKNKLQLAYSQPKYEEASKALEKVGKELKLMNKDAYNSLQEGFEETLTLHSLGLAEELGISFKTTNCIENVNSLIGRYVNRIKYWRNSDQRQRWLATALLESESRLHKVKGHEHLKLLKVALIRLKKDRNNGQQKLKEAA